MKSIRTTAAIALIFLPVVAAAQDVSVWSGSAIPSVVDGGDGQAVELGLKFKSDVAGSIAGVRFYKAAANKGSHVGNLWTAAGAKLATVKFTNETASGWQQAYFSAPVSIQPNTVYIVSYYAAVGHYSISKNYFTSTGADNSPLHAPSGTNGVYKYGSSSAFPNQTWNSSNYWVDVVFRASVSKSASSVTISSSLNPAGAGQAVTFTATVAGGTVTPTGSVQFLDGSTVLGTATLASGRASLTTSALAAGSHAISASYSGDAVFLPAASAVLTETVNAIATTTTVSSSANPSTAGQTVAFTAVVAASNGAPTGSVQFKDGSTVVGTATLASGRAVFSTSSLATGSHVITASYSGDGTCQTSSSASLTQTVNGAATTTTLSSSANPANAGQSISFTATVTAATGTPTGSVQFKDGSTVLGTAALASGRAVYATSSLAAGSHSITASYGGGGSFVASSSAAVAQTVNTASTTTVVNSSANPSTAGQAVTFTATVTAASGTPTGSVQFKDGATVLGTSALAGGAASLTTSSLTAGSHSITASYSGDGTCTSGTSAALTQTVRSSTTTTTTLTSSANPATSGQSITFAATVTATSATPTGSVQFLDGSSVLANVSLASGRASFVTSSLTAGSHSVTASYAGDGTCSGSSSAALTQTVTANPATTTSVSSSLNPSIVGQNVSFTAAVTASSGTATGSVQFLDGATVLGTKTLGSGTATLSVSSLAAGAHSITVSYGGDGTHTASASPALSQQVQQPVNHSAVLSWTPSTSSGVTGYNVYRGTTAGGPYVRVNSTMLSATAYTDTAVQAGQTYYFVCTALDGSSHESGYSNEAQAVVPNP